MDSLIHYFILGPVMAVTTWTKRHKLLSALLVVSICLLPALPLALLWLFLKVIGWIESFLGKKIATFLADLFYKFYDWLKKKPIHSLYIGLALLVLFPPIGAAWLFWAGVDEVFERSSEPPPGPKTSFQLDSPAPAPADPEKPADNPDDPLDFFGFKL